MPIELSGGGGSAVSTVTANYNNLNEARLRTTGLTQAEIATIEGDRYDAQYTKVLGSGEVVYLQFTMPDATRLTGFIERNLKATEDIDFELFWDPTGVVKSTPINIFNENQINPKVTLMEYTEVTSVTTEGTLREEDFIKISTQGNQQTSGEITPATGFRIYDPDRVALIKLTSGAAANRVQLTYKWIEAPTGL